MTPTIYFSQLALCVVTTLAIGIPVLADATSPHIDDRGQIYSKEAPNYSFYGTGTSGRLSEASALRFDVEQDLEDRKWDEAIVKAAKAVELDSGFPESHMLYARALTGKLYANKGPVDEELLNKAMGEWKTLALHDADLSDQTEARTYWKKMARVSKALVKARKEKQAAEAEVAEKQAPAIDDTSPQLAQKQHAKDE